MNTWRCSHGAAHARACTEAGTNFTMRARFFLDDDDDDEPKGKTQCVIVLRLCVGISVLLNAFSLFIKHFLLIGLVYNSSGTQFSI